MTLKIYDFIHLGHLFELLETDFLSDFSEALPAVVQFILGNNSSTCSAASPAFFLGFSVVSFLRRVILLELLSLALLVLDLVEYLFVTHSKTPLVFSMMAENL
jgi:hypothetical protein